MIHVLDNGLEISNGNLQFAWFKLSTQSGDFFRCVALHELTSIPFDVNNETDTLGLQWAALKGIYDARVDYIYTAMGIFHPDHIGVVHLLAADGDFGRQRDQALGDGGEFVGNPEEIEKTPDPIGDCCPVEGLERLRTDHDDEVVGRVDLALASGLGRAGRRDPQLR